MEQSQRSGTYQTLLQWNARTDTAEYHLFVIGSKAVNIQDLRVRVVSFQNAANPREQNVVPLSRPAFDREGSGQVWSKILNGAY